MLSGYFAVILSHWLNIIILCFVGCSDIVNSLNLLAVNFKKFWKLHYLDMEMLNLVKLEHPLVIAAVCRYPTHFFLQR
jgi:putative Mn2+ efflux pump MntP